MSGCASSSSALYGFMLPPYWIRTRSPSCAGSSPRMKLCACSASSGVAVRPVPIAHTGS